MAFLLIFCYCFFFIYLAYISKFASGYFMSVMSKLLEYVKQVFYMPGAFPIAQLIFSEH